jgi:hypothetical protein
MASSRVSGGTPPRQGVHVFSASISLISSSSHNGFDVLPVDFPEYDVERTDDRRNVSEHVAAAQEIHGLQMGK